MKNKLISVLLIIIMVFGILPFASMAGRDDPFKEDPFTGSTTTVEPTESSTTTVKPTESSTVTEKPTESSTVTEKPTESSTVTVKPTESSTVTVKPTSAIVVGKVKNLKLTVTSLNSVTLKWDKAENATSYRVYRNDGNGAIKLYSTVTVNSFSDKNLKRGKTYSYQILALTTSGGVTYRSDYSYIVKYSVLSKKIGSFKVGTKKNKAICTVSGCSGATGYQITYSVNKNFKKSKTKLFTSNKFTLKGLKKNKRYYIKIRGVVKINGKTYYTDYLKKNFKTKK